MTLNTISKGKKVTIKKIDTSSKEVQYLMILGLVEDTEITCITRYWDLIELKLFDSILVISQETAKNFIVV